MQHAVLNGTKSSLVIIGEDDEYKLESFVIPQCYHKDLLAIMIPHGLIIDRVKRLAQEINDVIGDQPLVLLCILKGSYRFFTLLVDELTLARSACFNSMLVDFIRLKSYVNSKQSGSVEIVGLSSTAELKGKNVLIVEDIVDTGTTLTHLLSTLDQIGVEKNWTAILLSKRRKRDFKVQEDFVAFEIPDKFIVGFGLDYNQKFRDLSHICVLSKTGIERHRAA